MKKWIAMLLCLLLIGALTVSAGAEGPTVFKIAAEKREAQPGEELTFTVTVQGSDACKSYGLVLEYDPAVFEVTGGECTAEGALMKTFAPDKGFAVFLETVVVPGETLGIFTLRVKEGAAPGETVISGLSSVKNGDVTIPSEVTSVSVTISADEAPEGTGAPDREESTRPADTREESTQPAVAGKDTADPEAPEETESVEHVSDIAQVLGDEGQQPENDQNILLWILIAAGVLCVAGVVWLILKTRKSKPKGKYLRSE